MREIGKMQRGMERETWMMDSSENWDGKMKENEALVLALGDPKFNKMNILLLYFYHSSIIPCVEATQIHNGTKHQYVMQRSFQTCTNSLYQAVSPWDALYNGLSGVNDLQFVGFGL